jgi:hypothetical protein
MPLGDGPFSVLHRLFSFVLPWSVSLSPFLLASLAVYFFSPVNNCRLVAVLLVAQPHLHPGCQAQTEALKTAPFASVSDRLVSQTTISRASQHGMAMVTSILWVLCGCALPSRCLISIISSLFSSPRQVGIWRGYVEHGRINAASGAMGHWRFLRAPTHETSQSLASAEPFTWDWPAALIEASREALSSKAVFHMSAVAILAFGVAASWQSVRLALWSLTRARWACLRHPPSRQTSEHHPAASAA